MDSQSRCATRASCSGRSGFTLNIFGVWGSVILWGISAIIGWILTWIYVEPAMMFPDKSGGISVYANEAWRKYTTFVGPIAAFGYWIGWSVVLVDLREPDRRPDPGALVPDTRPSRCTTGSST